MYLNFWLQLYVFPILKCYHLFYLKKPAVCSPDYKASYVIISPCTVLHRSKSDCGAVRRTLARSLKIPSQITACRCTNLQVLSIVQLWPTALLQLMHTSLHTTKHHADTQTRKLCGPRWTEIPQTDVVRNRNKDNNCLSNIWHLVMY